MDTNAASHGIEGVVQEIKNAETQVSVHLMAAKKLKARLMKAKKDLTKSTPVARLATLVADLKAMPADATPDARILAGGLERHLRSLADAYGDSLKADLRQLCEAQGVSFRALPEGVGVGPFALSIDGAKEVGGLDYAKTQILKGLPLDAAAIVKAVRDLASRLLQPPAVAAIAADVEEAMRVAIVRQRKPAGHGELRADLPSVFREMAVIRGLPGKGKAKAGGAGGDYSLPRFVVELKALVQSDENAGAGRRFRLETAVIENTKDPRKSIFVPADLGVGYGEGTYYQAVLLAAPGG